MRNNKILFRIFYYLFYLLFDNRKPSTQKHYKVIYYL